MADRNRKSSKAEKKTSAGKESLVEGRSTIHDLLDTARFKALLKAFHQIAGFPVSLVTFPGSQVLVASGANRACDHFLFTRPQTVKLYRDTCRDLARESTSMGEVVIKDWNHGMVIGGTPVVSDGQPLAILVAGQVFLTSPDLRVFRDQGERYGFDVPAYLRAIKRIPVVTESQLRHTLIFLSKYITEIVAQGVERLRLSQLTERLQLEIREHLIAEKVLKDSETSYRALVERLPAAIYIYAVDNVSSTIYMSPQINNMTGYPAEEWMQDPGLWIKLVHPEDRAAVQAEKLRTNETGEKFLMEYHMLARDGRVIWIRDESVLLHDEKGKRLCWHGFLSDITANKAVETKFQVTEFRYRALVEQLPLVIYVDSATDFGKTLYLSPRFKEMFGYDPSEWSESSDRWAESIVPGDRERVMAEYERTFRTGEIFRTEYRMLTQDRRQRWIQDEAMLVQDPNTERTFWHGIMLDITERKQAEIALAESEERYRRLFDLSPDAIAVHRDGKILLANTAAIKLMGVESHTRVIGRPMLDFVHPDYHDTVVERARMQIQDGITVPFMEEKFVRLDGTFVDVEVLGAPIRFEDAPASLVIFHEITERKQSQERLDRQVKELKVLHAVGMAVTEAVDTDELINNVIQAVGETLFPLNFGVLLLDEKQGILRHHPSYRGNVYPVDSSQSFIPITQGVTGRVARTGEPCYVPDIREDEDYLEFNLPTRSELCVPIKIEEKVIGVLNTESPELNAFNDDDERLLQIIAGQLGLGIEKINLFETERIRREEAETLGQVAQAVTASLDVDEILHLMLDQLQKLLTFNTASVMLLDESGKPGIIIGLNYENETTIIKAANELLKNSPILAQMNRDHKAVVIDDVRDHQGWIWVPGAEHVRSFLAVPILARHQMIGALMIDNESPSFYTTDDLRVSQLLAQQMAIAIENARLYQGAIQASERRAILHKISQDMVTAIQEPELTYLSIHNATRQLMACDSFVIALHYPDKNENIIVYALEGNHRFPIQHIPADRGLTGKVVSEGVSVIVNDLQAEQPDVIRIGEPQPVRSLVAVPLRLGQNTTGMISAQSYKVNSYSMEEQALLEMLASYAAVAIENARLYQEAVRAAERKSIVHAASQEILAVGLDLERVYEAIHRAAEKMMPAEAFVLSILSDKNENQILAVYLFDEGKRWPSIASKRGEGLSGKVIDSGQPILVNDILLTPLPEAIGFGEGEDVRSILAVPLKLRDRVFGMLSVQSHLPNSYTVDDQVSLEMLGTYATVAIENARLYSETRHRLTELEAVNRISTALRVAQNTEQMFPSILEETLRILDCDAGEIWLFNHATGYLEKMETRGWFSRIHEPPISPGEGIVGRVFSTGEAINSVEFAIDTRTRSSTRPQIPSGWGGSCVPIRTGNEVIGALAISVELPRQLNEMDIGLLSTITEIAGNAIHRSNLYQLSQRQLQRLASLRTIDMAINTVLDLRVTLSILIDHLLSQLSVDAVAIYLLNPTTQTLYHGASTGFRTESIMDITMNMREGLGGQVARTRRILQIPELAKEPDNKRSSLFSAEGFVSYFGLPLFARGQVKGVLEILHRSPLMPDLEWKNFLETLAGQAAIAIDNATLFEELQQTNVDLSLAYDATIEGWSRALDLRDRETEGHTQRVTDLTLKLAKQIGVEDVDRVHIRRGALLHDIGKMGVPDNILYKAGPLDEDEWQIMRQHPLFAYEMLYPITYLRPALDIPYGHHERWDGSGYPRRLRGEQIPLAARIFSVVDVWDALTSDRPYRDAWTKKRAYNFIQKNSGIQFDPDIVTTFLPMVK